MTSAFVSSDTVKLTLSGGRWVEVKSRLSWGETQKLNTAALVAEAGPDGTPSVKLDLARHALARLEMWLVDWNFSGADGKTVTLSPSAIANLDPDVAQEISSALDAHVEAIAAGKATAPTPGALIPRSA